MRAVSLPSLGMAGFGGSWEQRRRGAVCRRPCRRGEASPDAAENALAQNGTLSGAHRAAASEASPDVARNTLAQNGTLSAGQAAAVEAIGAGKTPTKALVSRRHIKPPFIGD